MLKHTPQMNNEQEASVLYGLACCGREFNSEEGNSRRNKQRYVGMNMSLRGTAVANYLLGYTDELGEGQELYDSLMKAIKAERARDCRPKDVSKRRPSGY